MSEAWNTSYWAPVVALAVWAWIRGRNARGRAFLERAAEGCARPRVSRVHGDRTVSPENFGFDESSDLGVSENRLCTPLYPLVLLIIIPMKNGYNFQLGMIIIPMKNGYFIGNINPTFSDKPISLPFQIFQNTSRPFEMAQVSELMSNIALSLSGFVWKCWVNIPNEIAIFHRDNDQQNQWVQWGLAYFQTHPSVSQIQLRFLHIIPSSYRRHSNLKPWQCRMDQSENNLSCWGYFQGVIMRSYHGSFGTQPVICESNTSVAWRWHCRYWIDR